MRQDEQQLNTLEQYFASYRERKGVLSIEEAKEVIARPDMLQTKTTRTLKPIAIMSTIFAAAVSIVLLRLFTWAPDVPVQNQKVGIEAKGSQATTTSSQVNGAGQVGQSGRDGRAEGLKGLSGTETIVPVPEASLDSFSVIELPESILAQIGVEPNGDGSINLYIHQSDKDAGRVTVRLHGIDLKEMKLGEVPSTMHAVQFYPALITTGSGGKTMYQYSQGSSNGHSEYKVTSYDDASTVAFRKALESAPRIPGLSLMGYDTKSMVDDAQHRTDTITINIGWDVPAFPGPQTPLAEYPESVRSIAKKMAEYRLGNAPKPSLSSLPAGITLTADTMTFEQILEQLDRAEQTDLVRMTREASKNLSELIPVAVRTSRDNATPSSSDFILWYEPTEQFLAAMPHDVRARINSRIASANTNRSQLIQSLTAAALTQDTIRVDYSISKATTLGVGITDLTGRLLWHKEYAVTADNGTLELHLGWPIDAGIYLLTTTTSNGERLTSRLFVDGPVQNAATKSTSTDNGAIPEAAAAVHFVELNKDQLARLGLEDSRTPQGDGVSLYTMFGKELDVMTVLRDWGVVMPQSDHLALPAGMKPANRMPAIVTDALGKKRIVTMETSDSKSVETEKQVSDEIGSMIPILMRDKNDGSPLGSRDLVLWYFATPELLAALPADAQQPVTQVTVTNDKTKDVASVSTPSHGAIASASVFPNPSHGNISVHVNLQADRTISLRLLDLSGKELVRQSGSSITPKGGADLRLDASAVGEGVYILDVTSDVGEHSFSKVMIIR